MFNLKKIFNICLIVFFIAFCCFVCMQKFNSLPLISGNENELTVYEWWHIESFEGGSSNRYNYLKNICLSYEKNNPTVLFMVKNIDAEQLETALQKNSPHIISFSEQVANIVLPYLQSFDQEYDVRENFLESAKFNGKLMAIPYIASGYCYFTKNNSNSELELFTANNSSHSALPILNNQTVNNGEILTSYECYSKFVNSNNIKLLGTARDLHRVKNLQENGRLSATFEPVDTFSDLIQYIGVIKPTSQVLDFINYIMNDTNQYNLKNIGLFSTKHINLYTEEIYSSMENAINKSFIPNIFTQ